MAHEDEGLHAVYDSIVNSDIEIALFYAIVRYCYVIIWIMRCNKDLCF
jgi:hypothetical protein